MIAKGTLGFSLLGAMLIVSIAALAGQTSVQKASAGKIVSVNAIHHILRDDARGHAAGWDPDGKRHVFTIKDKEFGNPNQIVLIDTQQANFVVCSVDFWNFAAHTFEVNCVEDRPGSPNSMLGGGPSNGANLNYAIFNIRLSPAEVQAAELAPQTINKTQTRESIVNSTAMNVTSAETTSTENTTTR